MSKTKKQIKKPTKKEKKIISIKQIASKIKKIELKEDEEIKTLEEALENLEEENKETTFAHSLQPIDIPDTTLRDRNRGEQNPSQETETLEEGVAGVRGISEETSNRQRVDYQANTPSEGYEAISPKYDEVSTEDNRDLLISRGRTVDIENIPQTTSTFQRTNFVVNPELQEFKQPKNAEDYRIREAEGTFQRDEFQRERTSNPHREERKYREKR